MENEESQIEQKEASEMHKRRELMPDGKRYIIYYTFENEKRSTADNEVNENV